MVIGVMSGITNGSVYLRLYFGKKYKYLLKNEELNMDMLKIDKFHAPSFYLEDDTDEYYVFESEECSSKGLGMVLEKFFQYCHDGFVATVGYSNDSVQYRYDVKDGKISFNGYDISNYSKRYHSLKNYIISAVDRFSDYFIYIEDEQFFDEVVPNEELDCDDFETLANNLKNSDGLLVFEIPYMEEVAELIGIVEPKLKSIYQRNMDEESKKFPKFETIFVLNNRMDTNKKKAPKKKSFFGSLFDREADLWGLSREDRRIAREERMSPADYVEAEERDDDELLDDE